MKLGSRQAGWAGILGVCAVLNAVSAAPPTKFTYQGQLKDNGVPVNGTYDLQFILFEVGAAHVAGPICSDEVEVINGLFTVELDFGLAFDGRAMDMEVDVRPGGTAGDCAGGTYTRLAPRQPIHNVPYALHALNVPDHNSLDAADGSPVNAVFVNNAGQVGIGNTGPQALLQVGAAYTPSAGGSVARFNGMVAANGTLLSDEGNVLSRAPAGSPAAVLQADSSANPGGAVWFLTSHATNSPFEGPAGSFTFYNGEHQLLISSSGNVGLGTTAPQDKLHVFKGDAGNVLSNSNASVIIEDDATTYLNFMTPPTAENGVLFGIGDSSSASGGVIYNNTATPLGLQFRTGGNGTRMVINSTGQVGIGTTTPQSRLHVAGEIRSSTGGFRFPDNTLQATAQLVGPAGPPGPAGARGQSCWDLNNNGVGNVATEDLNGDGVVNVDDCRGPAGPSGAPASTFAVCGANTNSCTSACGGSEFVLADLSENGSGTPGAGCSAVADGGSCTSETDLSDTCCVCRVP